MFVYRTPKPGFSTRFRHPVSATVCGDILRAQAKEYDLNFSELSIFEYRGVHHRTVVEMPQVHRSIHEVFNRDKAWRTKNAKKKAASRSDADRPLWYVSYVDTFFTLFLTPAPHTHRYIWEAELQDSDEYNKTAAERKLQDPEKLEKKKAKSSAAKGKGKAK